jgi:MraZ protein
MFVGEYEYKVDNKGRMPLPPKFRKEMDDGLMLTMGADNCITAYTKADWAKLTQGQTQTTFLASEDQRKLDRFIFANANDIAIDNQGRIALPATLRERCGIFDVAVITGVNNRFEIWSPAGWQGQKITADNARELMDRLEKKQ